MHRACATYSPNPSASRNARRARSSLYILDSTRPRPRPPPTPTSSDTRTRDEPIYRNKSSSRLQNQRRSTSSVCTISKFATPTPSFPPQRRRVLRRTSAQTIARWRSQSRPQSQPKSHSGLLNSVPRMKGARGCIYSPRRRNRPAPTPRESLLESQIRPRVARTSSTHEVSSHDALPIRKPREDSPARSSPRETDAIPTRP